MRRIVKNSCVAMRHALISRKFSNSQCPFSEYSGYAMNLLVDMTDYCIQCNSRIDNAISQISATVLSCEIFFSPIQSYKLPVHHIVDEFQTKSCPFGVHHVKMGKMGEIRTTFNRAASGRLW
jgi:hypothetical protein